MSARHVTNLGRRRGSYGWAVVEVQDDGAVKIVARFNTKREALTALKVTP